MLTGTKKRYVMIRSSTMLLSKVLFVFITVTSQSSFATQVNQHITPKSKRYHLHNPFKVNITKVHAIFSNHFDSGCKIPGCSPYLAPGEPNLCAETLHGTGEPFSFHVINRYFDEFLLQAAQYASTARANPVQYPFTYKYMAQPWVLSLFLDCNPSQSLQGWPELPDMLGKHVWHCPNASTLSTVRSALENGDIFFHGFPHDGEASYYFDDGLFNAALNMSTRLSNILGVPSPISISQRDVPGWTRAALPLLAAKNITGRVNKNITMYYFHQCD